MTKSKSIKSDKTLQFEDILFKPEWEYRSSNTNFIWKIGIIPGHLMCVSLIGKMSHFEDVTNAFSLSKKVIFENQLMSIPYILLDYSELEAIKSLRLRQLLAKETKKINNETDNSNAIHIIVNPDRLNKIAIKLVAPLLKQKFVLVGNMNEAFKKINTSPKLLESESIKRDIFVSASDIEELTNALFMLQWADTESIPEVKVSPNNPLAYFAESLELLKSDLNELRENERRIQDERLRESENNRKQLIEMMQEITAAMEKAEESERLKSAFLSNISHEIRTPLNGILGFTNLLSEPDLSKKKQGEYIKIIQKSGSRLLNIINDVLDISKIEAGLMEAIVESVNVNEQIDDIISFFKPEADDKGLKFYVYKGLDDKEAVVQSDCEKLYAIFSNLVKNAIKYADKGKIEIGYDLIRDSKSPYLKFFVNDSGIGIPEDKREFIFRHFVQADITNKQAYQGAGLGLSIAKAFVEMLGGKIWVEGELGVGSEFYFTIPYNRHTKLRNSL